MTKRKNAFTLAEVLITLSVIGIVAALTIPGLVKNHNEKAWATAQDVFTKKLEVAMKAMNTDGTLTGYNTTASFVNALKKNIKITKVCTDDVTKCFSKEVIWNADEDPVEVTNTAVTYDDSQGQDWAETVGVQFANGVTALLAYNKNCTSDPFNNQFAASASCVGIIYDVSANKNPNATGKDIAFNKNVAALGGNSSCAFEYTDGEGKNVCFSKILSVQSGGYSYLSNADCISRKSELGLDYCYEGNDYYAGAAAACGGKAKLPSQGQLQSLAMYLYDGASIASGTVTDDLTLNTTKAAPFLAMSKWGNDGEYSVFYISSNVEDGNSFLYFRGFQVGMTNWTNGGRDYDANLAVCLGE